MPVETKNQDLTIDDFITGLLAGMAVRGVEAVSLRGRYFYEAIADSYERLREREQAEALNLRFLVILDRVYNDSPVVRDAISGAVQRDLVSLDNPEYLDMRLKVSKTEARMLLDALPGSPGLFETLAENFINNYPWVVLKAGLDR